MTYRVRNIGIAVALALVAALLTTFYLSNYRRHVQRQQAATPVLVAVRDIPAGTPGAAIAAGHYVAVQNVVEKNRVPGAFTAPEQLARLVATQEIFEGEQVSTRRFGTIQQTGIRTQLTGTLRGFEVDGDPNQMLAGILKAGDHVDLVAALKQGSNSDPLSRVVLRNLKVLQAPPSPTSSAKIAGGGQDYNAILALTDSQTQKFQLVISKSGDSGGSGGGTTWRLALRPPLKDDDSPDHLDSVNTVLGDGIPRAQRQRFLESPANPVAPNGG
jgi:Flp pilus assembly protein CpaB